MEQSGFETHLERIILVAPGLELRGSTAYTLVLARELKLRGYRVAVMAGEGNFADELADDKIPFIRAEISGVFLRDLLYLNQYTKLLRPFNPDLIHVTHHDLAAIGGLIARRLRTPYLVTIQSPVKRPITLQRRFFKGAIAISHPSRQSTVNVGHIPREMVHIVENGVVTGHKPPSRDGSGLIPVVGTVSRLVKDRGIKYFIRAAKELISRNVQAHFLIMGTGPEEAKLRKLVRRLDMGEHITINMPKSNYRNLMEPIDLFVSPALSEGFGIFVLHAMASAIPVVASAAGGVFSLIKDNETGLIVPKRDVAIFADKIQAFLNDRPHAEQIGMNGFQYVHENFPLQKTLEGTLKLYHLQEAAMEV